jgi:hypothetical protein
MQVANIHGDTALTVFRHVCKIARSDYWLCNVYWSVWKNSASTGWIVTKFDIQILLKDLVRKLEFN